MAPAAPTYDLTLLLDLSATDEARAKIVADTRAAIERSGTLLSHQPWGTRSLAYPVKRREAAEYHLYQFNGEPELLEALDHTLRITDGVLRYRIVKLAPGTAPLHGGGEDVAAAPEAAEQPAESAPVA